MNHVIAGLVFIVFVIIVTELSINKRVKIIFSKIADKIKKVFTK